jgi:hypothetical protein
MFTKELTAVLQITRDYFDRYPTERYETVVESWREVPSNKFEFTMKRLREPLVSDSDLTDT